MQMESIPVDSSETDQKLLDIYLSLNFNEQWEPLLGGRVKYGLQSGTLKLYLENCEISLNSSQLKGSFHLCDPSVEEKLQFLKLSEKYTPVSLTACEVYPQINKGNFSWLFEVKTGESVLRGFLKNTQLGTLKLLDNSWGISSTFELTAPDIHLTDAEGLWRHDIIPNKHAILERVIVSYLLETKLKPYLSYSQLSSDNFSFSPPIPTISSQNESSLKDIMEKILQANSHDFLELATLANLNYRVDFAGGVLRGTELRGIDFSGANLSRANLRGADLCDGDLSEANLCHAKLGGADLSGAFLGDADLSYADFHRASLALTNLSGANLKGANLHEVNLVNANLHGALVEGAKFGKNSGIPEEVKHHLIEKGAIFEE
jgi:uncharacterized protein YjbI with pentapeptide repeats